MTGRKAERIFAGQDRRGIALLVTLIMLVVLSAMAYTLSAKVSAQRHRNQYLIDYQSARYGCDSAVRIAVARLADLDVNLISRPNEPDFSDVFHFTEQEYQDYLTEWKNYQLTNGLKSITDDPNNPFGNNLSSNKFAGLNNKPTGLNNKLTGLNDKLKDMNEVQDSNGLNNNNINNNFTDFNEIPGPYGPPWPLVAAVEELEIGQAKVKIEMEDENAKFPLGWAILGDKNIEKEKKAAFDTFFQWWRTENSDMLEKQIYDLGDQLYGLSQVQTFAMTFEDKEIISRMGVLEPVTSARSNVPIRTATRKTPLTKEQQLINQGLAFTKLFHSSAIDLEALGRPIIESDTRKESVLKYLGTWSSRTVNINTAPRNVLEAAFTFGGRPEEIADAIIEQRKIEPFKSVDQLKKDLFTYSDSIDKCKNYITTVSTDFTLKITSVCGVAKVSVVVAVTKSGKNVKKIAVISS